MAAPTITFFFLLLLLCKAHSFVFNSFKSSQPNLTLSGSALITRSGLLQLTNSSRNQTANVFYSNPFHLLSTKQSNATNITSAVSFSTTFIFTILTAVRGGAGGHGFTFAISPTRSLPLTPSANPNYLGLFNPQTTEKPPTTSSRSNSTPRMPPTPSASTTSTITTSASTSTV
ncbi:unnamed protein product [Rhodiola kirilowii]